MTDALRPALIAEASKKAAVVWLSVGDAPAYVVWCAPIADALYVVTGPGEQPAPGLAAADVVRVSARGDHGGLIAAWEARVERIHPGTEGWDAVAPQLAAKRLNAAGTAEAVAVRWASECTVLRLAATSTGPMPS